jgi:hypothetical protein
LSYQAKAYVGLNMDKEAAETIKKALSIKFSKSLLNNLKEIEGKNVDKQENVNFVNNIEERENFCESENSVLGFLNNYSLFKFFRVMFISLLNCFKRNRNFVTTLIVLCLIILRKKLKLNY